MLSLRRAQFVIVSGVLGGILGLAVVSVWALPVAFRDRVLPGVTVAGVPLGGKTTGEARAALTAAIDPATRRLRFARDDRVVFEPTLAEAGVTLDVEATVAAALAAGRRPGWAGFAERAGVLLRSAEIRAVWRVDRGSLRAALERQLAGELKAPKDPSFELAPDGSFVFQLGEPGVALAFDDALAVLEDRLARASDDAVPLWLVPQPPAMSDERAKVAGASVARVIQGPLALVTDETEVVLPPGILAGWVRPLPALSAGVGGAAGREELDQGRIEATLRSTVASLVARPPRDAQFAVSGGRATTFQAPADGVELLAPESAAGILRGLAAGADRIKLATRAVPPKVAVTPAMATYGIQALIAQGETDFAGSPRNRIHNIRVGAQKYNGLLVPPGGEFSFNENLGPVDAANGFLPELVILANVTTPQYGGGLCQVSTTMFRSAIHAGLPITARKNHAYAVSYYGTPGFDATIYPPNPDLRFLNDTPGHLLIQMKLEGTKLAFEFWGTPDGRQVEVLGPYPYDRQPSGAVKASLVRKVTRAGETRRDEWTSNYKSPKLFPKVLAANAERETWEQQVARIAEKDRKAKEAFERKKAELERETKKPPPMSLVAPSSSPKPADAPPKDDPAE